MLHITFSGIDKSGKTTLIKTFMEDTNYEHYVVDRDPSNYHFFNFIRKRLKDTNQHFRYESFQRKFNKCVDLAILLYADPEDIEKRFKKHNEPKLVGDLSVEEHMKELEFFFDNAKYKNTLKINTSLYDVDSCLKVIKRKIECL